MATIKLAKLGDAPEIFHTLQGEGVSVGLPSVFIRSSLCNLHCSWCDTAYTWNWEGSKWEHEDGEKFSKSEYLEEIETSAVAEQVVGYGCLNVVLTGGEPLLQQLAWEEIITKLRDKDADYRFEVETNGTQLPNDFMAAEVNQWNVSAKLSNSGNAEKLRIEGRDEATLQQRRLWLADLCRDQGYRFSDRLHIQLWGSKRGV